jgi:hypothetical protein
LFEHAIAQTKNPGADFIKIESDPNAEGFYKRMGAKRVGARITKVEGEPRELPLLEFSLADSS